MSSRPLKALVGGGGFLLRSAGEPVGELEAGSGGAERREPAGGNVRELSRCSPSGKPLGLTPSSGAAAAHLVFGPTAGPLPQRCPREAAMEGAWAAL